MKNLIFIFVLGLTAIQCTEKKTAEKELFLGADLSYVNEMMDCGAEYRSEGKLVDPYSLFAKKGCNLVRVRLWHNPNWTNYSNFADVKRTLQQAKKNNMKVLFDFHYSDTWADPQKQLIPKAWKGINDLTILGDSVYNYTYNTLYELYTLNLLPEFVQVGNETNSEILLDVSNAEHGQPINWERNAYLLNRGLQAVRDVSLKTNTPIQSMIHIAQPENALWWFKQAKENGINNFDWMGLSYYPKWSEYGLDKLEVALDSLKKTYHKRIMIVETAYPYGFDSVDSASNILGEDALIGGYPATPKGQLDYMNKLTEVIIKGGGEGVIYWEPAWITSKCRTLWGQGSHWENATFFDAKNENEALEAFDFFQYKKLTELKNN